MRVKILASSSSEKLENDVNEFLRRKHQNGIRIVNDIKYQTFVHPSGIVNYSAMIIFE